MVRRSVLVVAFTSAACIKLAEFHPLDATSDGRTADAAPPGECGNGGSGMATATMSGTAICAAGPGYALRFPASGFHYPDQLRIGTHDVLGATPGCNEEDRIGMAAYPMPRFSADTPATGETATAAIVLGGPVVAKVAVNWTWHASTSCVPSGALSGTSTFTLFPDGRLVRFDQLTTPASNTHTMCDCSSGGQGFFVTAYVAFDPALSPTFTDQGGTMLSPSTAFGTTAPQLVCASGSDWGIGVAQLASGRVRQTGGGGAIALTYDFSAAGADTLVAGTQSAVTAYQIGGASCTPLLGAIAQYTSATGPQLHVHSTNTFDDTIGTERDGMYGGDNGTAAGLPVGGGTLTLSAPGDPIPPGWALWVSGMRLASPTASPARTGDWYQIQNGTNDSIIWFRDGLSGTATITVQPL